MATDLGKVGMRARGDWSSSTAYEVLDAVSYNNGLYIAKQAVPANTLPTNTTYWQSAIAETYKSVNCENITALTDLMTLLTLPTQIGEGNIGGNATNNLKTLISQPYSKANIIVFIRLIGYHTRAAAFEITAVDGANESYNLYKKYVWIDGTNRVPLQSAWESINYIT